ncbi:hypothetical protein CR203_21720 [Salipaludibacillus neizhouensis]|uniref:Inhibitor of sigma-G Gin n=1 Tax=Salipaludibacillus neizhouensis TaxID=885475 RepID=A0A3A9JXM0_9BACI|nr:sigma factor G inhibitor Gin [Salipaludibacillus neizhouensis]RKL65237.1 hypothetical protein CR203_21720 [Salipaludibacillus neizhouensis]
MSHLLKKEDVQLNDCLICYSAKERGIHVIGSFICEECERKMVQMNVEDQSYSLIVNRLGKIRDRLRQEGNGEVQS